MCEIILLVFALLDADDGAAFKLADLGERAVAVVVGAVFFGAEKQEAREVAVVPDTSRLRRDVQHRRQHARTATAEFLLQVFADGGRDAVFLELRVAVVHDMDNVRVDPGEFQVQEEAVEPRGVVSRKVEACAAFLEEILVELQRVGKFGEFLRLGGSHHFLDSLLRVGLDGYVRVLVRLRRVFFLEDVGEGREPEGDVGDGDSACRVEPCHEAEHDEQT